MSKTNQKQPAKRGTTRPPRLTKKAQLISLLGAKAGAEIGGIGKELGWQPHSVRAALTGLRKEGYELARATPAKGGPTRYRIVAKPSDAQRSNDGDARAT